MPEWHRLNCQRRAASAKLIFAALKRGREIHQSLFSSVWRKQWTAPLGLSSYPRKCKDNAFRPCSEDNGDGVSDKITTWSRRSNKAKTRSRHSPWQGGGGIFNSGACHCEQSWRCKRGFEPKTRLHERGFAQKMCLHERGFALGNRRSGTVKFVWRQGILILRRGKPIYDSGILNVYYVK